MTFVGETGDDRVAAAAGSTRYGTVFRRRLIDSVLAQLTVLIRTPLTRPCNKGLVRGVHIRTERVGFEPTVPVGTLVFETSPFSRSGTSPGIVPAHSNCLQLPYPPRPAEGG